MLSERGLPYARREPPCPITITLRAPSASRRIPGKVAPAEQDGELRLNNVRLSPAALALLPYGERCEFRLAHIRSLHLTVTQRSLRPASRWKPRAQRAGSVGLPSFQAAGAAARDRVASRPCHAAVRVFADNSQCAAYRAGPEGSRVLRVPLGEYSIPCRRGRFWRWQLI